jgi:ATP-dependent HslUV protease subunit HslV
MFCKQSLRILSKTSYKPTANQARFVYLPSPFHTYQDSSLHGTTVLCVRKKNQVIVIGDGQVTLGNTVVKGNARKVRRIGDDVIAGFAGSTADALTLITTLEGKIEEYPGQLKRACVELAKQWRTDKYLRKLEAVMVVADKTHSLMITGLGDVLEPPDEVLGIGSGGAYALAAARALMDDKFNLTAEEIAERAMKVAADICIYTNGNFNKEVINYEAKQ